MTDKEDFQNQIKNVLKVFAEEAKHWEDATDDEPLVEDFPGYDGTLTVGDLREARRVLQHLNDGTKADTKELPSATIEQIANYYSEMGYQVRFNEYGEVLYAPEDDNIWTSGGHYSEFVIHPLVGIVRK